MKMNHYLKRRLKNKWVHTDKITLYVQWKCIALSYTSSKNINLSLIVDVKFQAVLMGDRSKFPLFIPYVDVSFLLSIVFYKSN